jgi:hypothetical protein
MEAEEFKVPGGQVTPVSRVVAHAAERLRVLEIESWSVILKLPLAHTPRHAGGVDE